jgi:predicted lysophospholipase L1 biosynthesis ABC-type transport system permease subunit
LIVSKICGIMAGSEGQEPEAYTSLSIIKGLLRNNGQNTGYVRAKVRATNIGYANSISKAITAMGFSAGNINEEQQSRWDGQTKEMIYLTISGMFSLLCSAIVISAGKRISLLEQKESWTMLRWLGMKRRDIGQMHIIQAGLISMFGAVIGMLTGVLLPSFLPQELKGTSVFMLSIPVGIIAASTVLCVFIGLLSVLFSRREIQT